MQEHRIYWHRSAFSLSAQLHLIFSIYVQHSTYMLKRGLQVHVVILLLKTDKLTEVAGEGGPDLAPQNFLLSQQFRHLMRCKKYVGTIKNFQVPNLAHPLLQPLLTYMCINASCVNSILASERFLYRLQTMLGMLLHKRYQSPTMPIQQNNTNQKKPKILSTLLDQFFCKL